MQGFSPAWHQAFITNVGDWTNVVSRTADIFGVLGNDNIAETNWFKKLASHVQATIHALLRVVGGAGEASWYAILDALFPTVVKTSIANPVAGLHYVVLLAGFGKVNSQIKISPYFKEKIQALKEERKALVQQYDEAGRQRNIVRKKGKKRNAKTRNHKAQALKQQLNELDRTHIIELFEFNHQELNTFARKIMDNGTRNIFKRAWLFKQKIDNFTERFGGKINMSVALLNILNTGARLQALGETGSMQEALGDLKFQYYTLYTLNAAMAIVQAGSEKRLLALGQVSIYEEAEKKIVPVSVMSKSANFWLTGKNTAGDFIQNDKTIQTFVDKNKANWAKQIRGFAITTGIMNALSLAAVTGEILDIVSNDLDNADTELDRWLMYAKVGGLAGQGFGFGFITVRSALAFLGRIAAGAIVVPWISWAILIGGLIYLVASIALNVFKKMPCNYGCAIARGVKSQSGLQLSKVILLPAMPCSIFYCNP